MIGIVSWCAAIAASVLFFLLINKLLSHYLSEFSPTRISLVAVFLSAIITDVLIHIFILIESGYSEMMMWALISFPFVGLCLIFINFIIKAVYEWNQRG